MIDVAEQSGRTRYVGVMQLKLNIASWQNLKDTDKRGQCSKYRNFPEERSGRILGGPEIDRDEYRQNGQNAECCRSCALGIDTNRLAPTCFNT